ncbi:MAG: hypothetical protein WB757_08375 [Candidatus Cybelea sp.]|jgi:hypothetical protein
MRNFLPATCILTAVLVGCAGAQSPIGSARAPSAQQRYSSGNIFWNKAGVRLRYGAAHPAKALLTFWGPNGYFTAPLYCKSGTQISVKHTRARGNPSGYLQVTYFFRALGQGPDECEFTAILNNTGSPPIATINLHVER